MERKTLGDKLKELIGTYVSSFKQMDTFLAMQKPSTDKTRVGFDPSSSKVLHTNKLVFVRESSAQPVKVVEHAHVLTVVEHGSQKNRCGLGYKGKVILPKKTQKKENSLNQVSQRKRWKYSGNTCV